MSGIIQYGSAEVADSLSPYINERLSFDHKRCTVRYIGPVSGTSGTWLGVEWDSPSHGKHDGMHQGVRYFTCILICVCICAKLTEAGRSISEHSASFIRSTRALREPPVAFLDAVQDRYVPDSGRIGRMFGGAGDRIRFGRKVVEEVGFDRIAAQQSQLQNIRIVGVESMCIAGVSLSDDAEVRATCQSDVANTLIRVNELDLSANVIERWAHVAEIVDNMKALRTLKLSGNRFANMDPDELGSHPDAFSYILTLWLEDLLPAWQDIITLTGRLTRIKQLYLGWNELRSIPSPLLASNLRELNLAHNKFTMLSSLAPLVTLPALTSLVLEGNQISDLSSPPTFSQLTLLDLASNLIPNFISLNTLATDAFPALTSLRLSRNPFFTAVSAEVAHMLSLARIPRLTLLDYSPITTAERTNAELYHLSRISEELKDTARNSQEERKVLAEHPQWATLCAKHDYQLTIKRAGDEPPPTYAPGTLGARLVTLHIKQVGRKKRTLQLPRTISIYALKSIVGRAFEILPVRFRLIWETGEWDPVGGRGDEDEFSVDSDDGEGEENGAGRNEGQGRFVRREVEVVEGTSSVGFWIDGTEAELRLEEIELP